MRLPTLLYQYKRDEALRPDESESLYQYKRQGEVTEVMIINYIQSRDMWLGWEITSILSFSLTTSYLLV